MSPARLALAGFPGLPLAMLALPVYVHLPAVYAGELGMALAGLGLILLCTRLLDTVLDPLLGRWQDRLAPALLRAGHTLALGAAVAGFFWMLHPHAGGSLSWQLVASLLLVYLAHGWLGIALMRYGAALWPTAAGRARVVAWREGWGVVGVLLAAALPAWWAQGSSMLASLQQFYWVWLMAVAGGLAAWWLAPALPPASPVADAEVPWWRDAALRQTGAVLLLNALAMAIPATLLHFYVADVLAAPAQTGRFLLLYFAAAIVSLPGWVWLADRIGKAAAWRGGMLLALAGFVPVAALGQGDVAGFMWVCAVTGVALGADLALASALVADALGTQVQARGGVVFGAVSMLNKLALALAAGVALPLAAWSGYQPGGPTGGLVWLYAGLPALFKLAAWRMLRDGPAKEANHVA